MVLHARSLTKTQGVFSLSIDSLEIRQPGIYGLIGPNGCGKSTTAKIIAGILPPDSGTVSISLDPRDITMVTQKPYIMDDTVYNNLAYPLKLRGEKNHTSLCDEYLGKIGFLERKNQRARGLSGGEKQKLALLRAMIFNPQLIILDEAMTDLDLDSLDMFENMILEQKERTWIIISHQLAHVRRLCGYIFFMANGRLEAEGPAKELLRLPSAGDVPQAHSSTNAEVRRYLKHEIMEVPAG
jgi:ABC-type multidrug transport system ATPase subunit